MNSMGDFSKESNILKRYARRGQCFSTSREIMQLDSTYIRFDHPDIERNGHVFTDGCGTISQSLAKIVSEKFGLPRNTSAFQIRIGGAKGVLMVKPDSEMTVCEIEDFEIVLRTVGVKLRKSQVKFPSTDLSFNVVRGATFSQGFLNR